MIREIVKKGDPVLTKKCHAVTKFDQKLHSLLDDMRDTLTSSNGVGLAAPQVGILRRAVVVINDQDEYIELINPEIVSSSVYAETGCPPISTGAKVGSGVGTGIEEAAGAASIDGPPGAAVGAATGCADPRSQAIRQRRHRHRMDMKRLFFIFGYQG